MIRVKLPNGGDGFVIKESIKMSMFNPKWDKAIERLKLSSISYQIWWYLAKWFPERFGTGAQRNEAKRQRGQ